MDEGRVGRVWATIRARAREEGTAPEVRHACLACVDAVGAAGAALSLLGEMALEPVFATDRRSEELIELQLTLGEGPSLEAAREGPAVVANLSQPDGRRRWPAFAPAASDRGILSMVTLPIAVGAARLGMLDLYRDRPGLPAATELADGLAYADAILALSLDNRGGLPPALGRVNDGGVVERRAEVHQAAGMISVQLGVTVVDALARLRAHAFVQERSLAHVAHDVVARRLRFHRDGPGRTSGGDSGAGSPDDVGRD